MTCRRCGREGELVGLGPSVSLSQPPSGGAQGGAELCRRCYAIEMAQAVGLAVLALAVLVAVCAGLIWWLAGS